MKKVFTLCAVSLALCSGCQKEAKREQDRQQEDVASEQRDENVIRFNSDNIKRYKGPVIEVFSFNNPYMDTDDIALLLQTEKGAIPVHLGPKSFIFDGSVTLRPGQEVEVKGSEIYDNGRILLIAEQIKTRDHILKLRDGKGNPLWTGWKKD